jgi:hypothetical protein
VLHLTRISVTVRVIVQLDELEELDDFEVDVEVLESEVLVWVLPGSLVGSVDPSPSGGGVGPWGQLPTETPKTRIHGR